MHWALGVGIPQGHFAFTHFGTAATVKIETYKFQLTQHMKLTSRVNVINGTQTQKSALTSRLNMFARLHIKHNYTVAIAFDRTFLLT